MLYLSGFFVVVQSILSIKILLLQNFLLFRISKSFLRLLIEIGD